MPLTITKTSITSLWRILIIAVVGGIISIGGWVFSEVRDLPKIYTTLEIHNHEIHETRDLIVEQRNSMIEQTNRIEKKVNETNEFLRDYFAKKIVMEIEPETKPVEPY